MDKKVPVDNLELFKKYLNGNISVRNEIVKNNLPLVKMIVKRYVKVTYLSFDDLFQEGVLYLIEAIDRYDINKGFKFSTYAVPYIEGKLKKYISKNKSVFTIPYELISQISLYEKLIREGLNDEEIRKSMNLDLKDFELFKEKYKIIHNRKTISLDQNVYDDYDSDLKISDKVEDESVNICEDAIDNIFYNDFKEAVKNILGLKKYKIMCLRYGIDCNQMTQEKIGELYGVERQRISLIERTAKKQLSMSYNMKQFNKDK